MAQLAENLKTLEPDKYQSDDDFNGLQNSLLNEFQWSVELLSWSPDSRRLAFAAQIDGPSSDVYLYNLETNSIHQAENSIQNVFQISWSPEGEYIVFKNSEPGPVYAGLSLYAIRPENQVIDQPKPLYSTTWLGGGDWLSPYLLLIADGTDTAGNSNLKSLDIRTGEIQILWPGAVSHYAIDPIEQTIAVNTGEFADPQKYGVFLVTFSGHQTRAFDGLYWTSLFFRGGEKHRFLMQGESERSIKASFPLNGEVVGFNLYGKPDLMGHFAEDKISISPDNSWLLMYDDANLYLYDTNDSLVETFLISGIQNILWRPDSQAIFFSADNALYFLSIPNGKPAWIDECGQSGCLFADAAWLP